MSRMRDLAEKATPGPRLDGSVITHDDWAFLRACSPDVILAYEDVRAALVLARQSLIDHAAQLPLSRRDHGPILDQTDEALAHLDALSEETS